MVDAGAIARVDAKFRRNSFAEAVAFLLLLWRHRRDRVAQAASLLTARMTRPPSDVTASTRPVATLLSYAPATRVFAPAGAEYAFARAPQWFSRSPHGSFGAAVLCAFAVAQICDGAFTYIGITSFGIDAEANPLVAYYVSALGPAPAIFFVKSFALMCAATLHTQARHRTLCLLTIVYVIVAIWPWAAILSLPRL
jgi:hypothetical protein